MQHKYKKKSELYITSDSLNKTIYQTTNKVLKNMTVIMTTRRVKLSLVVRKLHKYQKLLNNYDNRIDKNES